jgi:hypothetical protein
MQKWLIAAILSLSALAAVPAAAPASPVLTELGVAVAPGATVRATNAGNILVTTPLETAQCLQSTMHGNVITNTGTQIEIEYSSVSFVGCGVGSIEAKNLPWCWKASSKMTADTYELRGGKCNEASKSLTLVVNSGCPYTRTALTGSLSTAPQDVFLTASGQEFVRESGMFCLTPIKFDITYTLETATSESGPLTIS